MEVRGRGSRHRRLLGGVVRSLLFIPMNEKPCMAAGAIPKANLVNMVRDVLKVE